MSLYTYVYRINPLRVHNIGKSLQTLVYKHTSSKMNSLRTYTQRDERTHVGTHVRTHTAYTDVQHIQGDVVRPTYILYNIMVSM